MNQRKGRFPKSIFEPKKTEDNFNLRIPVSTSSRFHWFVSVQMNDIKHVDATIQAFQTLFRQHPVAQLSYKQRIWSSRVSFLFSWSWDFCGLSSFFMQQFQDCRLISPREIIPVGEVENMEPLALNLRCQVGVPVSVSYFRGAETSAVCPPFSCSSFRIAD